MFCLNCGKQLEDGAVFCGNCGHRVERPATPVPQETVIVPEVPAELPVQEASPMDRPTMVVPEVPVVPEPPVVPVIPELFVAPEQDPLKEMYPEKPEKPEKKIKVGLIIGMVVAAILLVSIAVVVVLGVMNDWWRTSPNQDDDADSNTSVSTTAPTDPDTDPKEPTADDLRDALEEYYAGGLYFYLDDTFEEDDREDNGRYYESKDVDLYVRWGWLDGVDSSEDYAKRYKKDLGGDFEALTSDEKNGITYMVVTLNRREVAVVGFYVQDGYGWIIEAITDEYEELGQDLINYVTLGVIEDDFVPPEFVGTEAQREEMGFAGLYLNLDSTFELVDFDEYAYFTSNGVDICVQLYTLSELNVTSSKEYAELLEETMESMDWSALEVKSTDNGFYYVLMISEDKLVNLAGLYVHEATAWLVTGETRDYGNAAQLLTDYVTSGRVVPEEIPGIDAANGVTVNGLTLPLNSNYKETFRGEYVILTDGVREVYIFTGKMSEKGEAITSAADLANAEYDANFSLWDNVRRYTIGQAECLVTWDNDENTVGTAYGFYGAKGWWWMVQVRQDGQPDVDALLDIVCSATLDTSALPNEGHMVERERIEMAGQSTAEHNGLRICYGPDWVVNDTWGSAGGYRGGKYELKVARATAAELGINNAVDYAWAVAEEAAAKWDFCEVGLADGLPYVLMYNEGSEAFSVVGVYADGASCWSISVDCFDSTLVDEAVWYATAGTVL